jgi:hypothetical protein
MKNHFISIISRESIIPIGHVISKKSQLKLRDRYKKFLPAASILMTFVVWAEVIGIFCILYSARVVYSRLVDQL